MNRVSLKVSVSSPKISAAFVTPLLLMVVHEVLSLEERATLLNSAVGAAGALLLVFLISVLNCLLTECSAAIRRLC